MDDDLADKLAMRNLALAPASKPLLVACPSCHLRLRQAQYKLNNDKQAQQKYQRWFAERPKDHLEVIHLFELIDKLSYSALKSQSAKTLKGLRCAPYYGCMLMRPPAMRREKNYQGLMEKILLNLGAEPVRWSHMSRCCGTFLSVARPDVVTPIVNQILADAAQLGAECIVTACAMCHLNLELRCDPEVRLPVFHFSELLLLALGNGPINTLLERHLIDPKPLLISRQLGSQPNPASDSF
jgi:heterodisulfide reductase subunit B